MEIIQNWDYVTPDAAFSTFGSHAAVYVTVDNGSDSLSNQTWLWNQIESITIGSIGKSFSYTMNTRFGEPNPIFPATTDRLFYSGADGDLTRKVTFDITTTNHFQEIGQAFGDYPFGSFGTNGGNQGLAALYLHDYALPGGRLPEAGINYWKTTVANVVPEPETYAMMMAGLGLLGVVARRRKLKAVA